MILTKHIFLSILISLVSFAHPPIENEGPSKGLVAYYSFNNCDAKDDSGNGSDGELYGGVSCWCGIEDDGLQFDGVDDYVTFSGNVNRYFNTSDFTISFYFKQSGYAIFKQTMLTKRDSCGDFNMFEIQMNKHKQEVDVDVHETPEKDYPSISPEVKSVGWHHFALVRKGTKAFTYIDGELRRTGIRCSGVDIGNEAQLAFADSPCVRTNESKRFKGILDELRVFDKALTHEEILQLYSIYLIENALSDCYS